MSNQSTLLLEHHLKEQKLPTFLREYRKLAAQCAAVVSVMAWGPDPLHAQGNENDHVDVAMTLEYPDEQGNFRAIDIIVMNHGARTAYDVEVVVHIVSPENATYFRTPLPDVRVGIASIENNGYSYRWRIHALTGLQREIIKPLPMYSFDASPTDRDPFDKRLYPHQFFAEVATSSFERDLHKENNTDRIWFDVTSQSGRSLQTKGRYSIKSVSVDEANPSPGDLVNFSIAARMPVNIDIQIAVELTDGLTVDVDSTAEPHARSVTRIAHPPDLSQPTKKA